MPLVKTKAPKVKPPEGGKPKQAAVANWEKLANSLRNYTDWLGDAAPGATDIDLLIHQARGGSARGANGTEGSKDRFLLMEFKETRFRPSRGQDIALRALAKQPGFTVVKVLEQDDGSYWCEGPGEFYGAQTKDSLRECVRSWWNS